MSRSICWGIAAILLLTLACCTNAGSTQTTGAQSTPSQPAPTASQAAPTVSASPTANSGQNISPDRLPITENNIDRLQVVASWPYSRVPVVSLMFASDNARLVIANLFSDVWVEDLTTGERLSLIPESSASVGPEFIAVEGGELAPPTLGINPEENLLAIVGLEGVVTISSMSSMQSVHAFQLGSTSSPIGYRVAFNSQGDLLAQVIPARGGDRIRLWSIPEGVTLGQLQGHTGSIQRLAFHPYEAYLATAASDSQVMVWDLENRMPVLGIDSGTRQPTDLIFSHDGSLVACASRDGIIRFWAFADGSEFMTLDAGSQVASLAFSPTAPLMASLREDGVLQIWSIETQQILVTVDSFSENSSSLLQFTSGMRKIVFSPDGTLLGSTGHKGVVQIWGVTE